MYAHRMATTVPGADKDAGAPATTASAKFAAYGAALKEAGVGEDDLRLLRELAELNALTRPVEAPPPTRILL